MKKTKRNHVPCRNCGIRHNNPSSSSICCKCGHIEYIENLQRKEEIKEMRRVMEIESKEYLNNE